MEKGQAQPQVYDEAEYVFYIEHGWYADSFTRVLEQRRVSHEFLELLTQELDLTVNVAPGEIQELNMKILVRHHNMEEG